MERNGIKLLQGIDTVILRVKDITSSKRWYQEKLDLVIVWEDPAMKLAVLDTHCPTSLTIWETSRSIDVDHNSHAFPIFRTPDAPVLREELLKRGVKVGNLEVEQFVIYFTFNDPDGNRLEACQVKE